MDLMPQAVDEKGVPSARLAGSAVVTVLLAAAPCSVCVGCSGATAGPNAGPNGPGPTGAQHCLIPFVTAISPTDGSLAGGDVVTITGRCFTELKAVDFGQTAAQTVTANKAGTRITATSPPGTGAPLGLSGDGVKVQPVHGSMYHYRYYGLRLLIDESGTYYLLPEEWKPGKSHTYVIGDSDQIRIEFSD
jgi:hypothetical protein